jgi:hypothetical protein
MTWSEVYLDLVQMLRPILDASSRTPPVIRLSNGGRIDFWSLENSIAGRGRRYRRIVIDEAAFTRDGDNRSDDSMMALWEKGIKPTLFDYGGDALVCSNSAGRNPDNFFYNICTDSHYGFQEFHAITLDNPLLPKRTRNESHEDWHARRTRFHEDLRKDNDPMVYAQEYLAEFVDWSGVAFFSREKLLVDNQPLPLPARCDAIFAVVDTASKTGMCIVNWSSTRTELSRRRSSTSDAQEITCLTKSRAFVLATETATERTTYSTRFATASRWRSGIAKASDLSLLSNDRRGLAAVTRRHRQELTAKRPSSIPRSRGPAGGPPPSRVPKLNHTQRCNILTSERRALRHKSQEPSS